MCARTFMHNYAVSGVSHMHATQQYHNALQTCLNACIPYITDITEDLNTVTTVASKVGTTVRRNVNRPHKHMISICDFSKQKCTL